jgi:hypothetical protein
MGDERGMSAETEKKALDLSPGELTWLAHQQRKASGQTSKYIRHQGAQEKARRLRQLAKQAG